MDPYQTNSFMANCTLLTLLRRRLGHARSRNELSCLLPPTGCRPSREIQLQTLSFCLLVKWFVKSGGVAAEQAKEATTIFVRIDFGCNDCR